MMLGVCGNVIWRCSKLVIRDWRLEISWKVGWLIGLIGLIGLSWLIGLIKGEYIDICNTSNDLVD